MGKIGKGPWEIEITDSDGAGFAFSAGGGWCFVIVWASVLLAALSCGLILR